MKTKYLLCIVILLATGGSLFAQNPTNVTGIITDPSSVAYYPAQVTACLTPVTIDPTVGGKHVNPNIGANYCIGPIPTAPSGAFSMALYANGNITPGATQWVFTVQTAGSGPPAGKGAQAFSSAAVTISGSSQDVSTNLNSVGPTQLNSSSSSSSSPNAPTIYAWDAKYNLPQPAKWVCDATFTSGSPTVTTPVTDRPFLSTDSFAIVVGGAAQCGGNPQATITTLTPANATATFVSAHTITLSGNALASCTPTGTQGGCALFWGPDHTAAIQAAFNDAANNCGTLVLPAGGLIVNSIVNNTTSLCPLVAGANGEPSAVTVKGQGPWSTMLLFTPNVSFAASSMFGTISGGINVSLHDFGVASFTQATAGFAGQSGFFISTVICTTSGSLIFSLPMPIASGPCPSGEL